MHVSIWSADFDVRAATHKSLLPDSLSEHGEELD